MTSPLAATADRTAPRGLPPADDRRTSRDRRSQRPPARGRPLALAAARLPAPAPRARWSSWPPPRWPGSASRIAIPLVTKAMIDGPIADGDIEPLLPLGLLALGLGILEAVLIFLRRWVQSNAVLGVETAMRHDLYARLQQLPMAFHGRWQSGQLLSRVTTDLSQHPPVLRLRPALPGHQRRSSWSWSPLRAAPHVLAARPGRRGRRGPDHRAVQPLRAPVRRGLPPGAGPAGRPRHPRRGGRRRHPGDQVLRPRRATSSAQLRRRRPHALRHLDGQGPAVREVLDLPRGDPQPRRRRGAAARRARRRPRRPHPRHAGRLHHADAVAGLADRRRSATSSRWRRRR